MQLEETVHLNLVLYDQHDTNSSSLRPPTEPEEEEQQQKEEAGDKRQKAFYCCLPPPPAPPRPTSRCLIRLANRTALSASVKEALPWERSGKRGRCHQRYSRAILAKANVLRAAH